MIAARSRHSALELEILKEMAEALGRSGERLERAIGRYRELALEPLLSEEERRERLAAQAKEILKAREWLMIQREALGLRDHAMLDSHYPLPFELAAAE